MALFASSYIPTVATTVTRNKDALSFALSAKPEALSIYMRFIELGQSSNAPQAALLTLGGFGGAGFWRVLLWATGSGYQLIMGGAGGQVSSSTSGANIGQLVELLGIVNANGSVQLTQVVAGVSSAGSASAAITLPWSFGTTTLWLGQDNGSLPLFGAVLNGLVLRGVQPLATMQRLAGVN